MTCGNLLRLFLRIVPEDVLKNLQVLRLDPLGAVEPGEGLGRGDRLELTTVARLNTFLGQFAQHRLQRFFPVLGPGQRQRFAVRFIDFGRADRGGELGRVIADPEQPFAARRGQDRLHRTSEM